jgi:hypothetical protein
MQNFSLFFELGWQHILNWQAYDHLLFIIALCGIYLLADWRKVLILVTAFTIGHSLTLALSVFSVILVSTKWIEFLIPVTIVITAAINIAQKRNFNKKINLSYIMALFFGLIHGLGFSNYLKSLLGKSDNIVTQLFAFNVGLEVGQIIVVIIVLSISFLMIRVFKKQKREWQLFLSSAIFGVAILMAIERFPGF